MNEVDLIEVVKKYNFKCNALRMELAKREKYQEIVSEDKKESKE